MIWTIVEKERDGYDVSTDPASLDLGAVHAFLARSYWSPGIPREVVERAAAGWLCFGLHRGAAQVDFARMITHGATFAYLWDVYLREEHRGQGRGRWLLDFVMRHPQLQGPRRMTLITRDAHGLYSPLGFAPLARPEGWMEKNVPDAYGTAGRTPAPKRGRRRGPRISHHITRRLGCPVPPRPWAFSLSTSGRSARRWSPLRTFCSDSSACRPPARSGSV